MINETLGGSTRYVKRSSGGHFMWYNLERVWPIARCEHITFKLCSTHRWTAYARPTGGCVYSCMVRAAAVNDDVWYWTDVHVDN